MLPACQPPTGGKTEEDSEGQSGEQPGGQTTPPQQTAHQKIVGFYKQSNYSPSRHYSVDIWEGGTLGIMYVYNMEGIIALYNIDITSPGPRPEIHHPGYVTSFYFGVRPRFKGLPNPIGAHYYQDVPNANDHFVLDAWDPVVTPENEQPKELIKVRARDGVLQQFIDNDTWIRN